MTILDTTDEFARTFGRRFIPDDRDERFPVSAILPPAPERGWRYWWRRGWQGYQGKFPHCVSYAHLHTLHDGPDTAADHGHAIEPVMDPRVLYDAAQRLDQWPGQAYDGTSVRAGAKALQERGIITGYRWVFTIEELVNTILTVGPVVAGTRWYEQMSRPDADNVIRVGGKVVGGHAYKLDGVNTHRGLLRVKNSWHGMDHLWLPIPDADRLLREHGEACLHVHDYAKAA